MASQQIKWKQQYKRGLYIRVGVPKVLLQDTFRFPQLIRKRQRKTSRSHNRTVTITALEKQSQPQIYGRMRSLMSGLQSVKRRIRKWSDLKEHLQISGTCWELSADRQNQVPQEPHIKNCSVTLTRRLDESAVAVTYFHLSIQRYISNWCFIWRKELKAGWYSSYYEWYKWNWAGDKEEH